MHRSGSWSRVFYYLWKETAPSGLKAQRQKTPGRGRVWSIKRGLAAGGLRAGGKQALGRAHYQVTKINGVPGRGWTFATISDAPLLAVAKASRWRTCVTAKERRLRNEEGILADCGGPDWF